MHRLIDYLFVNVSAKINQNQCMCVKVGLQQATLLKFFTTQCNAHSEIAHSQKPKSI